MAKTLFFDRLWYGPLLVLPWARRQHLIHAVQRGKRVADPCRRNLAVAYARRQIHQTAWLPGLVVICWILWIADLAVGSPRSAISPSLSLGGTSLVAFAQAPIYLRARRFVRANRTAGDP